MEDSQVPYINCTNMTVSQFRGLSLARGVTAMICCLFCVVTLVLICIKKRWGTTYERLFLYLTIATVVYLAVLSMHMEHYYHYFKEDTVCHVVGFLDQSSGLVQLLFTLEVALFLLYQTLLAKRLKQCIARSKKWYKDLNCKFHPETFLFTFSLIFPFAVAVIPFYLTPYGEAGPWCWIRALQHGCTESKQGRWEKLGMWYIPFLFVALCSFLALLLTVGSLIRILWLQSNDENQRGNVEERQHLLNEQSVLQNRLSNNIAEYVLLACFLFVYCILCGIEVVLYIITVTRDSYSLWFVYAISTPISGVIIPFAFFLYLGWESRNKILGRCRQCCRSFAGDHPEAELQQPVGNPGINEQATFQEKTDKREMSLSWSSQFDTALGPTSHVADDSERQHFLQKHQQDETS